jgi:hypothetical protein
MAGGTGMTRYAVVAIAWLALAAGAVLAGEPSLSIQLNKLEPVDSGCRIYFVIENQGEEAYDELTVDLVTFDPAGIVGQRLLVELGPLRAAKTAVSSFDFEALECAAIDRILVNDVTSCLTPAGPPDDCVGRIALSSLGAELLF